MWLSDPDPGMSHRDKGFTSRPLGGHDGAWCIQYVLPMNRRPCWCEQGQGFVLTPGFWGWSGTGHVNCQHSSTQSVRVWLFHRHNMPTFHDRVHDWPHRQWCAHQTLAGPRLTSLLNWTGPLLVFRTTQRNKAFFSFLVSNEKPHVLKHHTHNSPHD